MSVDLEHALRELLKSVLLEVLRDNSDLLVSRRSKPSYEDSPADQMLLRTAEAAEQLAISESQLRRLARTGVIPSVRIGGIIRYSSATLQEWIRKSESTDAPTRTPQPKRSPTRPDRSPAKPPSALRKTITKKPTHVAEKPILPPQSDRSPSKPRERSKAENQSEQPHRSRFSRFAEELGIDRESLPPMTNGDIRRIAEVDIPTMHGWLYLSRGLPEDALAKLRDYLIANGRPKG